MTVSSVPDVRPGPRDLAASLAALGDLHDCRIVRLSWDLASRTAEIMIEDIYANFAGLPEYRDPKAALLRFQSSVCP